MTKRNRNKIKLILSNIFFVAIAIFCLSFFNYDNKDVIKEDPKYFVSANEVSEQRVEISENEFIGTETFFNIGPGVEFTLSKCSFEGSTNSAIVVDGGILNLKDCTIKNSESNFEIDLTYYGDIYETITINASVLVKSGTLNILGNTSFVETSKTSGSTAICLLNNSNLNLGTENDVWTGSISSYVHGVAYYDTGETDGTSSQITMNSGLIDNCTNGFYASSYVESYGSTITINDGTISNGTTGINTSLYGSTVCIDGGKITGNRNYGVSSGNSLISMAAGEICDNGGGIEETGDGNIHMSGGKIHDNTAYDGGGISSWGSSGYVTITGGEIYNNIATHYGGGVYCDEGANELSLYIRGGKIYGNTALNGGGVYAWSSELYEMSMSNGEIINNTATYYGGGICVEGTTFSMNGGKVSNNVSTFADNICIGSDSIANISGGEILSATKNALSVANYGEISLGNMVKIENLVMFNEGNAEISFSNYSISELKTCGNVNFKGGISCEKIVFLHGQGYEPSFEIDQVENINSSLSFEWMDITGLETDEETGMEVFVFEYKEDPLMIDCVVGTSENDMSLLAHNLNATNQFQKYEWQAFDNDETSNLKLVRYSETLRLSYFNQNNCVTEYVDYKIYPYHEDYDVVVDTGTIYFGENQIYSYEFEANGEIDITKDSGENIESIGADDYQSFSVSDLNGDRVIDFNIKIKQEMQFEIHTGLWYVDTDSEHIDETTLMWDYGTDLSIYIDGTWLYLEYGEETYHTSVDYNLMLNKLMWGEETIQLFGVENVVERGDYVSNAVITLRYDYSNNLPSFEEGEITTFEPISGTGEEGFGHDSPGFDPTGYPFITVLHNRDEIAIIAFGLDCCGHIDFENCHVLYHISTIYGYSDLVNEEYMLYGEHIGYVEILMENVKISFEAEYGDYIPDADVYLFGTSWNFSFSLEWNYEDGEYYDQEYTYYLQISDGYNYSYPNADIHIVLYTTGWE